MREKLSDRMAHFLRNVAQSIDMVALEVGAHGLADQQEKLRGIAMTLREKKTQ